MSRKAAERRASPSAFVEPQLWVVTRGREYKPRFNVQRAVVIISGGSAVTADAPVTANGTRRTPQQQQQRQHPQTQQQTQQQQQQHPLACLLHHATCAETLFARTACEALYVIDYSPIAHDMTSELASPYPGRVAKPVGRLLQKLNVADAVMAAEGADAVVLLKTLPLAGDEAVRAALVRHPHRIPPAGVRALVAASGGAVTRRPVDVVCAAGAANDAAVDLQAALPAAVFVDRRRRRRDRRRRRPEDGGASPERQLPGGATTTGAATETETETRAGDGDGDGDGEGLGAGDETAGAAGEAAALGTLLSDVVAAVEVDDGVSGPPDWLSEDAPVFYQRVTFVHDTDSKQIVQRVEGVTKEVKAARACAEAEAAAAGAAAVVSKEFRMGKRLAEVAAAGVSAGTSSSTPSPPQQATTAAAPAAAPAPVPPLPAPAETSASSSSGQPVMYAAKRPFHHGRLASLLRRHFTLTMDSTYGEVSRSRGDDANAIATGEGGAAESVVVAADAAARAAASAAAAAELVTARLNDSLGATLSNDPTLLAVSAVVTSSSAAAAAAAASAAAAAHLLSRLVSSSSHPETRADAMKSSAPVPDAAPALAPASGPFSGVESSAGVVWIASRPSLCGVWTQPDPDRPGAINVACAGAWDRDATALCALGPRPAAPSTSAQPGLTPAAQTDRSDGESDSVPRGTFLGERRQELVFEGSEEMNHARLRAALDECLLTEDELNAAEMTEAAGAGAGAGALVLDSGGFCFVPWPEQVVHLASLGVRIGGRGSAALTMAALNRHGWGGRSAQDAAAEDAADDAGGTAAAAAMTGGMSKLSTSSSGAPSSSGGVAGAGEVNAALVKRPFGVASLSFGGKVGIIRPEAFVAPPRGIEVKQFPEGTGHFWPKMPCLECGSAWWLGDDWDAECANCGGNAESYDNNQQPHKEYKRRFERFRKLLEELVAKR